MSHSLILVSRISYCISTRWKNLGPSIRRISANSRKQNLVNRRKYRRSKTRLRTNSKRREESIRKSSTKLSIQSKTRRAFSLHSSLSDLTKLVTSCLRRTRSMPARDAATYATHSAAETKRREEASRASTSSRDGQALVLHANLTTSTGRTRTSAPPLPESELSSFG